MIDAISYLHSKNIVHRDLKLENIMINEKGFIKIIDFGISKELDPELYTNTVCGTAEYMAPELLEGLSYNKSVDLWAIGIIIYELMFGGHPFNEDDEEMVVADYKEQIQNTELFPDKEKYDIQYSEELKGVIL